ncbi:MAG: carbon-nitrogen hydrolase family protein [Opitutaceae bacterium]|nr:carbon-nitrogen hydrolase family protein [Opitutaceae bacterium]
MLSIIALHNSNALVQGLSVIIQGKQHRRDYVVFTVMLIALLAARPASNEKAPAQPAPTALRLALLHGIPEKWNVEKNFATFLTALEQASTEKADIFITPECWLDGYAAPDKESTPERLRTVAQDINSSTYVQRVAKEARERSMMICFGFTSLEEGKIFNTAGLWDKEGKLLGLYHKTHLQTHDLQYSYGEGIPVWPSQYGPLGMMICADRRWPETARTLRLEGAKLILNPTYGFHGDMNTAIMRTRAYENQCFIAFTHPEESLVTGPKGQILAQWTGDTPGIQTCDIDLSEAKDNNHLSDRRPELYGVITQGEEKK